MTDPSARVVVDGDVSPMRRAFREGLAGVKQFGEQASSTFDQATSPLEALRGKFLAITGLLSGGALFKRVIEQTAQFTEQSIQLGKALGVSASGASTWLATLEDVGATSDELAAAGRGLLKNLNDDEAALNKMGLATRTANGELRPMNELLLDAIGLTNEFKDGTDRSIAARQLFGKGVDASSNLLKINTEAVRENEEFMRELGLVVGQQQVEAYEAFDSATDKSNLVIKGFINAMGQVLMPVLTKLSEWFNEIGPMAVTVTRGAIGGLTAAFWALKNGVVVVYEALDGLSSVFREFVSTWVDAWSSILQGDAKGASDAVMGFADRVKARWQQSLDAMVASSNETRERIAEIFLPSDAAAAPKGGGTKRASPDGPKGAAPATPSSYMQYYEALLAEEKRAQSVLDEGREYTKQQELTFWRFLKENLTLTSADQVAVSRRTAKLEVDIARESTQQRVLMERESVQATTQLELGKLEAKRAAAKALLDSDQITKGQLAELELGFEDQRYAIQQAALQERLNLLMLDPNVNPVELARIKNEMLLVEQDYQMRRMDLMRNANQMLDQQGGVQSMFEGWGQAFGSTLEGIVNRTQTWAQSMAGLFKQTAQVFLRTMITEPFAQWVANGARMLAVKMGFLAQENVAEGAAAATNMGTRATEAGVAVSANAASAGSGAASAMAGIPYIGPILAIAAMAAVFAAVMGMSRGVKSAEGGFDIPKNLNPMTQLHEEEMVLPKQYANVIRDLASSRGDAQPVAVSSPAPVLQGVSAGDFFVAAKKDLVAVLKGARRDFSF